MNLEPVNIPNIDIGQGDLYVGNPYKIPYFWELAYFKMMHEPELGDSISFKTWKGEFFQFYLDEYHNNTVLVVTSTLKDCFYIRATTLSLEKSAERFQKAFDKKIPIEGSISGYFTYGGHLIKQYKVLKEHMDEQNIYFSDEVLQWIWSELKRRKRL